MELAQLPKHVAIIPDGNRRWAKEKNLPPFLGHKAGFEIAIKICKRSRELGINTLTLWAFSTENWNRSHEEKEYLFALYLKMTDKYLKEAHKEKIRIIHLGRKDRLPLKLAQKITQAERETQEYSSYYLNLALDYGGQDEILRAIKKFQADLLLGKVRLNEIDKEVGQYHNKYPYYLFKDYLDTADQPYPYPDLIIRTSGETRLSGYLLWQSVYSELYFENKHFPDFTPERFEKALQEYSKRKRRFGGN